MKENKNQNELKTISQILTECSSEKELDLINKIKDKTRSYFIRRIRMQSSE